MWFWGMQQSIHKKFSPEGSPEDTYRYSSTGLLTRGSMRVPKGPLLNPGAMSVLGWCHRRYMFSLVSFWAECFPSQSKKAEVLVNGSNQWSDSSMSLGVIMVRTQWSSLFSYTALPLNHCPVYYILRGLQATSWTKLFSSFKVSLLTTT